MESIGTLAGGIAHDFNNLLTVINGYATLILKRLEPEHPLEKKITAIAHAGKRAADLTRQLLAFSRKQIFSPSPMDINTTIKAMDQMLRRLIGEDIHVETILDKNISPISADQTQVEQIFTNLIINARDALSTRPGEARVKKRLTIETGQTRFNRETADRLTLGKAGVYVFFSVSDNGPGMDRETQKRIFEPFFTTKSKYKGTGLGLAMNLRHRQTEPWGHPGILRAGPGAPCLRSTGRWPPSSPGRPRHGLKPARIWPVANLSFWWKMIRRCSTSGPMP